MRRSLGERLEMAESRFEQAQAVLLEGSVGLVDSERLAGITLQCVAQRLRSVQRPGLLCQQLTESG